MAVFVYVEETEPVGDFCVSGGHHLKEAKRVEQQTEREGQEQITMVFSDVPLNILFSGVLGIVFMS